MEIVECFTAPWLGRAFLGGRKKANSKQLWGWSGAGRWILTYLAEWKAKGKRVGMQISHAMGFGEPWFILVGALIIESLRLEMINKVHKSTPPPHAH